MTKSRTQSIKQQSQIIKSNSIEKRLDWIDIYKGLAIILVVLGHCGFPWGRAIYQYHMAAFLFIAGYTSKLDRQTDFGELAIKKAKRLLIPYFAFSITYSLILVVLSFFKIEKLFFEATTLPIYQPIWLFNAITSINYTNPLAGASWFLITLFETNVFGHFVYQVLSKRKINDWVIWIISLLIFLVAGFKLYPLWPTSQMNYMFDLLPITWIFFYSGFLCNKYQLFATLNKAHTFIITTFVIWVFMVVMPLKVSFPERNFMPVTYVLLAGLNGSVFLWTISDYLANIQLVKSYLIEVGKKTLCILFTHFLGFKFVTALLIFFRLRLPEALALLTPTANNQYWWLYCIVSIAIGLHIDRLLRRNKYARQIYLGE